MDVIYSMDIVPLKKIAASYSNDPIPVSREPFDALTCLIHWFGRLQHGLKEISLQTDERNQTAR
jgi:hypothetical protein